MVGRWGMSARIGPVTVLPAQGQQQPIFDPNGPSPATRELVDAEARRIIDDCYAEALETLRGHRASLDRLATRLLEAETLDEHAAREAAGIGPESRVASRVMPHEEHPTGRPELPQAVRSVLPQRGQ
jgi:cell division protease FtsH